MRCRRQNEVRVLKSGAGYYIGTMSYDEELECEVPQCRLSVKYYKTEAEAQCALVTGFEPRNCMENDFCSEYRGCFVH